MKKVFLLPEFKKVATMGSREASAYNAGTTSVNPEVAFDARFAMNMRKSKKGLLNNWFVKCLMFSFVVALGLKLALAHNTTEASFLDSFTGITTDSKAYTQCTFKKYVGDGVAEVVLNGKTVKVRMIAVSTKILIPQHKEALAKTLAAYNGKTVYLQADKFDKDNAGNLLRYVWLAPPTNHLKSELTSKCLNIKLIAEGNTLVANADDCFNNVKYAQVIAVTSKSADKNGIGIYKR